MNKALDINYELTPADMEEFSRHLSKKQSSHKYFVGIFLFVFLAFILADFIYILLRGWEFIGDLPTLLVSIVFRCLILAGLIAAVYAILVLIGKTSFKKLAETRQNGLFCEHRIIFNENELIEVTDVNTSQHSWSSVGEIEEIKNFVLIHVNLSGTFVVPKRYFVDEERIEEFVETARYYQQTAQESYSPSHLARFDGISGTLGE